MPGSIISGVTMVALVLSAVTVVTMSAPRTASAVLVQTRTVRPRPARLAASLALAAGSVSNSCNASMPTRSRKASAWNSLCAPLPIKAMQRLPGRASRRAARAEVAAVRIAVVSVNSDSSRGAPVCTSASTPNAITVASPTRVLAGWPLTYLKANCAASAMGISSITPLGEWQATRLDLSNSCQRRKSCSMRSAMPAMQADRPLA